jgi:hypothetical protein
MRNACVKTAFITKYCGVNSVIKPDTVRHALYSCVKIDSWLLKQPENVERDIEKSDVASSIVDGSPAEGKYEGESISNGLPGI